MAKVVGFFSDEELDTVGMNGAGSGACDKCGLSSNCKTPHMGYTGEGRKGILIVAEAPSDAEDDSGAPMTGETGKWFEKKLSAKGINLDKDCWKTNAVGCHATKQKDCKPTKNQIKHCRPRLMRTIEELKPRFIWLMGSDAIYSYYHQREDNTNAERWRGLCIPDPDKKAWILPLYHPAYAIRMERDNHFQMVYDNDLSHAIRCSKSDLVPEHMDIRGAKILKTFDDVMDKLEKLHDDLPEKMAFDYETTGLKPYRKLHKIATVSFCYDYDVSYAFPYQYRSHFTNDQLNDIHSIWCDILEQPKIKKIMHNSQYEDMWSREILGVDMSNKWWCSMNAAHILDTRSEFSGLKFQALINWGTPDYDASIEKYLKSVGKTPYNRVMEAPLNDLLLYNSIDSLLTFRLQDEQQEKLIRLPKMEKARQFIMEGLHTMTNMQENGIAVDDAYYLEQDEKIGKQIVEMTANLHKFPEAKQFERERGRPINFGSSQDLADLFFNILQLPRGKQTAGGNDCVDAAVLETLNTPIAKEKTKISKLGKIKGTYLGQFIRESEDDNRLHPFFSLHTTNTMRGSSSGPNFQNIPVRDEMAMNITRGGVMPSFGNILDDWDYGAMEVKIIASVTQDPVLVAYCSDPTTDMHRDQAMDSFSFTKEEWDHMVSLDKANKTKNAKNIRFHAKNGEVFAWFYGSYYGSSARSLFPLLKELKTGDCTLFEHLRNKGIIKSLSTAYENFEKHLEKVEKRFWDKYKVVKKWQDKAFASYLEKGYIEQMFGFRIGGWLTKNDICNYPIQGTAFHCLVWSVNQLDARMKDTRMDSKLIGQIHDCCLGDIVPSEQDMWDEMSYTIATKEIRDANPWIIVPLETEYEKTEINMPWSTKKEFHPKFLSA